MFGLIQSLITGQQKTLDAMNTGFEKQVFFLSLFVEKLKGVRFST
jgi:hypothetical protein